ncbi:MAG: DUF3105 domain-containing protein [Candidatus Limnocylindrales bacterium]
MRKEVKRGLYDQYRGLILGGAAVLGVGLILFIFVTGATAKAYSCDSLLQPGASESVPTTPPTFIATPTPSVSPSPSATATASASATASATAAPTASATAIPTSSAVNPTATASSSASAGASPSATVSPTAPPTAAPTASPTASPIPSATASTPPTPEPSPTASPSPSPSPSPAPSPTQRLGFVTDDLGRDHTAPGSTIDYTFCPPTSGKHFPPTAGRAPLAREFYSADAGVVPGNWIHNLEHGWVVLAYRDVPGAGDAPTDAELAAMRTFFDTAAPAASCASVPNKVVVVRFDEMSARFALLAWDRALLTDTFDVAQALQFAEQYVDTAQAPERGGCP